MVKQSKVMVLALGLLLIVASHAGAQETAVDNAVESVPSSVVEVGNKICPVGGEEIGSMGEGYKYEYNGKIYNLCCEMCAVDFKNDPEKFSKIADDEVQAHKE